MTEPKKDDASVGFNDIAGFMQKMWNPFGVPLPGFGMPGIAPGVPPAGAPYPGAAGALPFPNPAAMFATLDPAELDRKIDEMKIIEGWLQMSLNLMQLSIKTMELQKASLEALRAGPGSGTANSASGARKP